MRWKLTCHTAVQTNWLWWNAALGKVKPSGQKTGIEIKWNFNGCQSQKMQIVGMAPQQPNAQRPRRIEMQMRGEKHWMDLLLRVVKTDESLKAFNHPFFAHRPRAKFPAQHLTLSRLMHLKSNLIALLELYQYPWVIVWDDDLAVNDRLKSTELSQLTSPLCCDKNTIHWQSRIPHCRHKTLLVDNAVVNVAHNHNFDVGTKTLNQVAQLCNRINVPWRQCTRTRTRGLIGVFWPSNMKF